MRKLLILVLSLLCLVSMTFIFASCGDNNTDTSSNKDTSSNVDTQPNSSIDTSLDSSVDTETNTDSSTDSGTTDEPEFSDPYPNADPVVKEKVNNLLSSKHKLTYNEDGSFRIVVFADLHMQTGNEDARKAVKNQIIKTVDKVNPNLVIFTGDNTLYSTTEEALRSNIDVFASYLEEKQIPWCHVFGNHDYDGGKGMTKEEQMAIYQSYEYCISKDLEEVDYGVGNYVHAIYNRDGTIGSVIYFMDSGEYSRYMYGFIQEGQINWYKETSELLQEYNNGNLIPAVMSFHIPLIENRYAYDNRGNTEIVYSWEGHLNEPVHPAEYDTELLETIWERGDVKAIFTGHDHKNDYSYNYKGVYLMSCPNISTLGYYDANIQGSRVIDLNLATINGEIPTYIDRMIERANPDDYDTLDTNVSLEFGKEQVDSAYKGNGSGGSAEGKYNINYKDGKGVNGSSAIEVIRGNSGTFDLYVQITNPGKVGDNKYYVFWADFTNVEFDKGSFGIVTEHGVSLPFMTDYCNSAATFYYLPDGETEWQELTLSENGCIGVAEEQPVSMNGKKGYFAFSLENLCQDLVQLTNDTLVTGIYFEGAIKKNINFLDKPFYICDFKLVEDYKNN